MKIDLQRYTFRGHQIKRVSPSHKALYTNTVYNEQVRMPEVVLVKQSFV